MRSYELYPLTESTAIDYENIDKSDSSIPIEVRRAHFTNGIDISLDARMQRAAQLGFDTTQVWYHGSPNAGFKEFSTSHGASGPSRSGEIGTISFTQDKEFADAHGGNLLECFLKHKNTFDFRNEQHVVYAYHYFIEYYQREHKRMGIDNPGAIERIVQENITELKQGNYRVIEKSIPPSWYTSQGFDSCYMIEHGALNINVFDPTQIRSINAVFDTSKGTSANIYE